MAEKPLKEQTESLEEQARLYRDIVEEKKIISELTVEELSFQRDLVEEQQNNLKELKKSGDLSQQLFDYQNDILESAKKLYDIKLVTGQTDAKQLAIWAKAKASYRSFIKEQEKSITLEAAMRKAGLGWLYDTVKLVRDARLL